MPSAVPLLATNVTDLTNTTLRNLGKPKFTEIATDLQKHTAMKNLLKKNRIVLESGYGVQWDVMVNHAASASNVGLGHEDTVNEVDGMVLATADWRNTTANYSFIAQIVDMNREPARIVDYVKVKRLQCMIAVAELMESNFWGPPVALTDNLTPWGANTWIVKNATAGFNGGVPSGYTTIGLNPTTYPRWKNYTFPFSAITRDDFIRAARKAAAYTDFEPPVDGIPTFNTGDDYGWYTNYSVVGPLEEALESQNENLGKDIASMDGKVLFRRAPVEWVPKLDADTTNPFYGINWGDFKTFILSGWWLRQTDVPIYPGQHTTSAHFLDATYQFITRNRRTHCIGSNGTSYPN
jgi:hypothetical protein